MFGRVAATASLAILAATSTGCSSSFFKVTPDSGIGAPVGGDTPPATPKTAPEAKGPVAKAAPAKGPGLTNVTRATKPARGAATTPAAVVSAPAVPAVADTQLPEPDPAPSDSAGVARLHQLMHVWHLVSLYHPAVIERGAPWDSAFIRAATVVRSANDAQQLAAAYRRMLSVLQDPLTRVELAGDAGATGTAENAAIGYVIGSERTRDSVLIVRVPLGAAQRRLWSDSAAAALNRLLAAAPRRVVLDVRGSRDRQDTNIGRIDRIDDDRIDAVVDRFASNAGLAMQLNSTLTVASSERTRRVGGARYADGQWQPDDAWTMRTGRPVFAGASSPRRVMVLANRATVLPRALLSLIASRRVTLLAEEGVDDTPLVSSVVLPMGDRVAVRIRTGELVHADGSTGLIADSVLPRAAQPLDSAPVLRAALSLLRTNGAERGGDRASRTPERRLPAELPSYYGRDPYPFMGARLLAAAQLWSAIRVRHAHRDLYDEDLDALLERTIPKLEAARAATEYAAALMPLVSALDDTPSHLQGASADSVRGIASVPFRVRWIEDRAIITDVVRDSVTKALGIETGMEVTAADGFPMPAWIIDHRTAVSAPNPWSRLRALMPQVARGPTGGALFRLRDLTNRERQLNIPRRTAYMAPLVLPERPNMSVVRTFPSDIVYLDVERLAPDSIAAILARTRGARAWLLDLRGTLGSGHAAAILAAVRSLPEAVTAREVRRYESEPCAMTTLREARQLCSQTRETRSRVSRGDTTGHYAGRIVALIDERTDGNMERLALALDAVARVTFIGSSSAGAPGEVMNITLPGLLQVALPIVELRRSDDGQLQRVGITPSVEVRLTVRGVRSGFDDVIERAQQWLVQQLDPSARRRR
ncbi:S41 family peptidase [Gemmatimonas sp.]|uniref:S41 family peptidase n=1 Tax=Gemmatimonas sp. TaxID=1962908 RepID=UPI003982F004